MLIFDCSDILLGALFVCFTVDHKLLFGQLTDQAVDDGFLLYANFYNAPPAIKVHSNYVSPCFARDPKRGLDFPSLS